MRNDPTGRALQLLSLLQTHRFWRAAELAERLGVTQRTMRRDVDRLRDLDYPVDSNSGKDGVYRLETGAHVPPLVLDDDEAVAVAVGLRYAAVAAIDGMEETSLRALTKIEQLLPHREIPGGDAAGFVASSLGSTSRRHDAQLAVHAPYPELEDVLRRIDHTPIELGADYCFVQIRSEDLGLLAMTIARVALMAPVTVIEPAELADTVSQLAIHLSVSPA